VPPPEPTSSRDRFHGLDAVRAFAMLLGVFFHAGFAFLPGLLPGTWAVQDRSTSPALAVVLFTSHAFRLSLFYFVAGFFARLSFHRKGLRGFAADRARRIAAPMVVGWVLVYPAIRELWIRGAQKAVAPVGLPASTAAPSPPPLGAFPMTHLWFLYYLLVLYVVAIVGRAAVVALDPNESARRAVDRLARAAVGTGAAALLLALPTSAVLYRSHEPAWFGVPTPDRSIVPDWPSLVVLGAAFAAGWVAARQPGLVSAWVRQWPFHVAGALVATAACLTIVGVSPSPAPAPAGLLNLVYVVAYGLATWCWSFAVVGLGTRYVSRANPTVRYLADASYWIYLAHFPIVVGLQVKMSTWPWPWSVKLVAILGTSLLLLFVSYHLLVRSTFVGETLNGRRYPRPAFGSLA
jgi:peptidoglycan/LPS O-acetylase OafA/YrhL